MVCFVANLRLYVMTILDKWCFGVGLHFPGENEKIASQRETFLLNTKLTQTQQSAEMVKFKNLYKTDLQIINIREKILRTAKVQLENGLITTIDYVKFLNDVSKAKQTQLLHETQLLLALYNLKITTGN